MMVEQETFFWHRTPTFIIMDYGIMVDLAGISGLFMYILSLSFIVLFKYLGECIQTAANLNGFGDE